jgi:aminocyclitol acetyltransferase
MNTKLQQILSHYLNGREVVIWGTPSRLLLRELREFGCVFRIADSGLDIRKHYVVAATGDDEIDFQLDVQSKPFGYTSDYIQYGDDGGELPFDWNYCGIDVEDGTFSTKIGKKTYFGEGVADACRNGCVKSIGRYTSINGTAKIQMDHQFNMSFVSDEVIGFFSDEHRALFERELLNDPKLPGTANKSQPLTIGNDVWLGAYSFINCSKVKNIGDGAIVGSGAVVLEDVPPYAVVVGVPARIIRYRYTPEQVETLLRVKWWDWSETEIDANAELLIYPEKFFKKFSNV